MRTCTDCAATPADDAEFPGDRKPRDKPDRCCACIEHPYSPPTRTLPLFAVLERSMVRR